MADRTKLDDFIAEIEAAAYQRGVADTWAKMTVHLHKFVNDFNEMEAKDIGESTFTVEPVSDPEDVDRTREPREGSDQAKVLMAIRETPGVRGVDIVNDLAGTVEERTVRTALHRLKKREAIYQREGKWYPSIPLFQKIEGQTPNGA